MGQSTVRAALACALLLASCSDPATDEAPDADATPPRTTASPPGGVYDGSVGVALSCDDAGGSGCAATYFTTDGTDPTASSAAYASPLVLSATTVLKFRSVDGRGNLEAVQSHGYVVRASPPADLVPPTTVAVPSGGWRSSAVAVALACEDGGGSGCAATYYTLDGSDPTTASPAYSGPILVAQSATLRFFSVDAAGNSGTLSSETYLLDAAGPTVTASPAGGVFGGEQLVTLSCDDGAGIGCAAIHYALDGSAPTVASATYGGPFPIAASATLRFVGVDALGTPGAAGSVTFVVDAAPPSVSASPAGGYFREPLLVRLACDDGPAGSGCAGIVYVLGPDDPRDAGVPYFEGLLLTETTTLRFAAIDAAGNASAAGTLEYVFDHDAPLTSAVPAGGVYGAAQLVTLACADATACAGTWYTLDGSVPTRSSTPYVDPIPVAASATLRFFSEDAAGNVEPVQTQAYTIDSVPPSASADPPGGLFAAPQLVTLSCDDGAGSGCTAIRYTTDGSVPTAASAQAWGSIAVSATTTLRFVAFDLAGNASAVSSETYTIDLDAPVTSVSPQPGPYAGAQTVTLSCDDGGGSGCGPTWYTTDGSMPTRASTLYEGPFVVASTTTVGFLSEDVAGNVEAPLWATYVIDTAPPATAAYPEGGTYQSPIAVYLWCDDGGDGAGCATTRYTTDGTAPSASSPLYDGPIYLDATTTLKFFSTDVLGNAEPVRTEVYTVDGVAPMTTASPAAGTFTVAQTVTLSCDDGAGSGCAATYYTTDGADPTTSSPQYLAPISISSTTTLKFRSIDAAGNLEAVRAAPYTIDSTPPHVLSTSPADGATHVSRTATVQVVFDEPMDGASFGPASVALSGGVTGTVEYDAVTKTASFSPSSELAVGTTYTATVEATVRDAAGNPLGTAFSFSFATFAMPDALTSGGYPEIEVGGSATNAAGDRAVVFHSWSGSGRGTYLAYWSAGIGDWLPEVTLAESTWSGESFIGSGTISYSRPLVASNGTEFMVVLEGSAWVVRDGVVGAPLAFPGTAENLQIVSNGTGYLAVWREYGSGYRSLFASSFDGGAWGTKTLLENQSGDVQGVRAASNGSGYAVTWLNSGTWVTVWDGTAWSTELRLQSGTGMPRIASDGTGYATLWSSSSSPANTYVSLWSGGVWSSPLSLGSGSADALVGQDGTYVAAYGAIVWTTPFTFYRSSRRYAAGVWEPEASIYAGSTVEMPVGGLAVAGGKPLAVLTRKDSGSYRTTSSLLWSRLDETGWTPPAELEGDAEGVEMAVHVESGGTTAVVSWAQPLGSTPRLLLRAFDGTGFGAAQDALTRPHRASVLSPALASTSAGDTVAVWYQAEGRLPSVFASVRTGGSWGAPVRLSSQDASTWYPEVAASGEEIMVCFRQYPDGVFARRWSAGGWDAPVRIDSAGGTMVEGRCQIAGGPSGFVAGWKQHDGTASSAWVNVQEGGAWGAARTVESSAAAVQSEVAVAAGPAGYAAAWVQNEGGVNSVFAARHAGGTWQARESLESSTSAIYTDVRLAAGPTGYAAAWTQNEGGSTYRPWASIFDGSTWSAGAAIAAEQATFNESPRLVARGSDYLAAWVSSGTVRSSTASAGTWSPAVPVGPGSSALALSASATEAAAVFATGGDLWSSRGASAWSAPALVEDSAQGAHRGAICWDGSTFRVAFTLASEADPIARELFATAAP